MQALAPDETGVALEPYRALLARALEVGGGACLLHAGRALEGLADPFLYVLLNSDDVSVLIEKEARLGRFFHSRHVVRVVENRPAGIVLEHASLVPEPPEPTESLANAGLHITLLELMGCNGLELRLPHSADPERVVYQAGTYHGPAAGAAYETWDFSWSGFERRRGLPGLDDVLLSAHHRAELTDAPESVMAVERIVRGDLGRTWTVAEVAKRLGASQRSLQRALASDGTRFSEVVDRVRLDESRRLLDAGELTITQIAYVCGFADAAHFSRRFKLRFGQPPSQLRASGGSSP